MAKKKSAEPNADPSNDGTDLQKTDPALAAPAEPQPSTAPSDANVPEGEAPPQDAPPVELPPALGQETPQDVIDAPATQAVDNGGGLTGADTQSEQASPPADKDEQAPPEPPVESSDSSDDDQKESGASNTAADDAQSVQQATTVDEDEPDSVTNSPLPGNSLDERIDRAKQIGVKNLKPESKRQLIEEVFSDATSFEQQKLASEQLRAQFFADMWQESADMLAEKILNFKE